MRSCDWFDFEVEAAHFTDETPREATIAEIDHKIRTGKVVSVSEINTWVHSSTGRVALAALREVA